jgi:hypothetical protein
MASDSRGNEKRFLYHFWDWFPIFKPVSEYAKSERFALASGFLLRRAVAHHTGSAGISAIHLPSSSCSNSISNRAGTTLTQRNGFAELITSVNTGVTADPCAPASSISLESRLQ